MILKVYITETDFIFDFGNFTIGTSKDGIEKVKNLTWSKTCLMIETGDDIESIGLEHLLFGEEPFNIPCDYVIEGREDNISRKELKSILESITEFEWKDLTMK